MAGQVREREIHAGECLRKPYETWPAEDNASECLAAIATGRTLDVM
jgi:hypothetical protein